MHDWPSSSPSLGVRMRITMSVAPPGPSGTTKRIGLFGHGACARSTAGVARVAAAASINDRRHMDVELLRMNPLNSGFASVAARRDGGRTSPRLVIRADDRQEPWRAGVE